MPDLTRRDEIRTKVQYALDHGWTLFGAFTMTRTPQHLWEAMGPCRCSTPATPLG